MEGTLLIAYLDVFYWIKNGILTEALQLSIPK